MRRLKRLKLRRPRTVQRRRRTRSQAPGRNNMRGYACADNAKMQRACGNAGPFCMRFLRVMALNAHRGRGRGNDHGGRHGCAWSVGRSQEYRLKHSGRAFAPKVALHVKIRATGDRTKAALSALAPAAAAVLFAAAAAAGRVGRTPAAQGQSPPAVGSALRTRRRCAACGHPR